MSAEQHSPAAGPTGRQEPPKTGSTAHGGARAIAYAVSALALCAVLYPIVLDPQDPKQDGFPLSTYPMFSYDKPRTASVTSALAIAAGSEEVPVPPEFVATSETMQALRTLAKSVRAGKKEARKLCQAIAVRVADSRDPTFARTERIAIVTVTVDSIDYLRGDQRPISRKEHVRCRVARGRP